MLKKDYLKMLGLFFWLWLPSMLVLLTNQTQDNGEKFAVLTFSFFILLCPLLIFTKFKHYFLFWTPLTLLIPPYVYLTAIYQSVPSDALVSAAIYTNIIRSAEVVFSFGWKVWLIPISVTTYFIFARTISSDLKISKDSRKKLLAFLLMYAMLSMAGRQAFAHIIEIPPLFEEYTANLTFPSNLIFSVSRIIKHERHQAELGSVHGRQFNSQPMLVVLVIGESVRSDHMGINGYSRNTTPLLNAYGSDLISFKDVASTANWTQGAIPNIVSQPIEKYRATLVQTFKEAGFSTAWLSNQEPSPFSKVADVSEHATTSFDFHLRKDASLFPLFESFVRQSGPQQFIVLHMIGSHIPYEERYTANSKLFSPTLYDIGISEPRPEYKAETINSYDNTIIEMDKFLDRVISLLNIENRPAVMLFTSDHGENLFDDERQLFMHAQPVPTRYDTHVPMLVWMNSHYQNAYPAIVGAIYANTQKKISHINIFPTILDMARLEWDSQSAKNSFASTEFTEKRREIISLPHQDYDSLK